MSTNIHQYPVTGSRVIPQTIGATSGNTWAVYSFRGDTLEVAGKTISAGTRVDATTGETLVAVLLDTSGNAIAYGSIEGLDGLASQIKPVLATDPDTGDLYIGIDVWMLGSTDRPVMRSEDGTTFTMAAAPSGNLNGSAVYGLASVSGTSYSGNWTYRGDIPKTYTSADDYLPRITAMTSGGTGNLYVAHAVAQQDTGETLTSTASIFQRFIFGPGTETMQTAMFTVGQTPSVGHLNSVQSPFVIVESMAAHGDSLYALATIGRDVGDWSLTTAENISWSFDQPGTVVGGGQISNASAMDYNLRTTDWRSGGTPPSGWRLSEGWRRGSRLFHFYMAENRLGGEALVVETSHYGSSLTHAPITYDPSSDVVWVASDNITAGANISFKSPNGIEVASPGSSDGDACSFLVGYKSSDLADGLATQVTKLLTNYGLFAGATGTGNFGDGKVVAFVSSGYREAGDSYYNPTTIFGTDYQHNVGGVALTAYDSASGLSVAAKSSPTASGNMVTPLSLAVAGTAAMVGGTSSVGIAWTTSIGQGPSVSDGVTAASHIWLTSIDENLNLGVAVNNGGTTGSSVYPTQPQGLLPSVELGGNSIATFTTTDPNSSSISWYFGNFPDPTYSLSGLFTSLLLVDPTTGVDIGEIAVTGTGLSAQVSFASTDLWTGSRTLYLVANETGTTNWSQWKEITVTVTPPTGPTAPTISGSTTVAPTIIENNIAEVDIEWTDPDIGLTGSSWWLELGLYNPATNAVVWSVLSKVSDYAGRSGGAVVLEIPVTDPFLSNLEQPYVTVMATPAANSSKLARHLVITPPTGFSGGYHFAARAVNVAHKKAPITGAVSFFSGTVTNHPVAPGAPFPDTMPGAQPGSSTSQIFTVSDPNPANNGDTFSYSLVSGSGTLSQSAVGPTQTRITFTPADGYTGPVSFYIWATNSVGSGPKTLVRGVVKNETSTLMLQLLDRQTGELTPVCYLSEYASLQCSEALKGSGQLQFTVSIAEIYRRWSDPVTQRILYGRLAQAGDSALDLLEPDVVEAVFSIGDEIRLQGPITSYSLDTAMASIQVVAMNVTEQLAHRVIENSGVVGTGVLPADPNMLVYNDEYISAVFEDLINREQAKPYGHLGLGWKNAMTTDIQLQGGIAFERNMLISAAMQKVGSQTVGGAEYWVNPATREFTVADLRGENRIGDLVFTERNSVSIQMDAKWDNLATVVRAEGTGVMNPTPTTNGTATDPTTVYGEWPTDLTATDADTTSAVANLARYGRHVTPLSATSLTEASSLEQLSKQYVQNNGKTLVTAQVTYDAGPPLRPYGVLDFHVGDFCTVEVSTLGGLITFPARIVTLTVVVADGASDSFQVQCQLEKVTIDANGNPVAPEARSMHSPELLSTLYDALFRQK